MIRTPSDNVLVKSNFLLAITAASTNGSVLDASGFRSALAVFDTSPTGSGTTSNCKLQEGSLANGSDMADVSGATFAQATTVGGHVIETMNIDLTKRKRYLRLVHTGAGGSAAGQASGQIHFYVSESVPPTQDMTPVSI